MKRKHLPWLAVACFALAAVLVVILVRGGF